MTASELNRKLLYCGFSDMTDYLRNSPLNRYLYKALLSYTQQRHIEVPMVMMFNEIYYQSIRVRYDSNPGYKVSERYIEDCKLWLNNSEATGLVFTFVWVLFKLRTSLSFHEECFMEQLTPIVSENNPQNSHNGMLYDMLSKGFQILRHFSPMPCATSEIPLRIDTENGADSFLRRFIHATVGFNEIGEVNVKFKFNPWRELTEDFSKSAIQNYVFLYDDSFEQREILKRIEMACPQRDKKKHHDTFELLRDLIHKKELTPFKALSDDPSIDVDTEEERSFPAGIRQMKEEEKAYQEELFKQKHKALIWQKEEQRKYYEARISQLEYNYSKEIEELKKALEEKQQHDAEPTPVANDVPVDETPKVASLTIAEMVAHIKDRFSKTAADEFVSMFYKISMDHGDVDEEAAKLIDDIIPAIIRRDSPQQIVDITTAHQVNVSPQKVENQFKSEKDNDPNG